MRVSLARCSEFARDGTYVALGRMHASLLRCDIDDHPPTAVAAELGLSERQLRRERRAAHHAFAGAFRTMRRAVAPPATVCDVVTVRLAAAVTLHELGQGALAQSSFASIAAGASSPGRQIEALCLAAEAEFDALRHAEAATNLADARTLIVRHAHEFDDETARAADEHVEYVAWTLRWQTATAAGLATQPPIVLARTGHDRARGEPRLALFVRAAAAYATQRFEVGDYERGRDAVSRARDVLSALHPARTKEHLALMMSDAQLYGLRARPGADRDRYREIEALAGLRGHVHIMLAARAERIVSETAWRKNMTGRIFDDVLRPFGVIERRALARVFAWVAHILTGAESDSRDSAASAKLAESILPARSLVALVSRCDRADAAIAARRCDEASALAQSAYSDAEFSGNFRVRARAARSLALIALRGRRRSEAQRYIREALSLSERFATPFALDQTIALARHLDVA
ncbi:MAG TPA: hypothetical protein VN224_11005 [Xanthomonadales bacterium]|nr:hypothetical protein [Xanthomonadales bacterium]